MLSTPLRSLSAQSVNQLAHLLQTLPHERGLEYGERVTSALRCLPSELERDSRLSNLLSANAPSPLIQARLCLLHRPLSASLIHEIFTLVSLEVGHHSNSLVQRNTWLSPAQHIALQQLRELHSLWLPERTYEQTFLAAPNPAWPYQKSGCEGCLLTRIGSDLQIVARLRALLLSRRRTAKPKHGHPRLLAFVDGWLVGLAGGGERGREMMQGSEMEGEELKIVRKKIWQDRRERRRMAEGKTQAVENVDVAAQGGKEKGIKEEEEVMEQEAYQSDFENEIIDHYAALRSTLRQSSTEASSAQLASLTSRTTGQARSPRTEISGMSHPTRSRHVQASSRYSRNQSSESATYEPPRRGKAWRGQASAGKQAEEYRNLLTPPLEEESSPRSKASADGEERRKVRQHHSPLMPHPAEPSPRPKVDKKEPWLEPKANKEDADWRQTTWSQFSASRTNDPGVVTKSNGPGPSGPHATTPRRQARDVTKRGGRRDVLATNNRGKPVPVDGRKKILRKPPGGVRKVPLPLLSRRI